MLALSSIPRSAARAWLVAMALVVSLALASSPTPTLAASFNGGGALNNLTEGSEATETTTTATTARTASTEEPHNSGSVVVVVVIVGIALLIGVAFVIVRDARKVAPASEVEFAEGSSARHTQAAMQKRRAKAKAARKHRRHNR